MSRSSTSTSAATPAAFSGPGLDPASRPTPDQADPHAVTISGLVLDPATNFAVIDVLTIFGTGIPLAGTGLALYGLLGKFVANGKRNLADLTDPDPIKRELQWFAKPAIQKYVAQQGQWAVGLGAVVGTLPDGGFTFNAVGVALLVGCRPPRRPAVAA